VEEDDQTTVSEQFKKWLKHKSPVIAIILIITTLVVTIFWPRVVITIESGQAGILFTRFSGTKIDKVYDEGLHIFSPLDKLYIYEVRKQVAFHEFDVISNKGLIIHLSLAVRYRPEYELLGILHQQIGPDYLNRVILPQIESVMRKQLGDYTAEEIYTNEAGLLTNAILTALDEVGRNYVEVEDIIIRSIKLPPKMVAAIEQKLKQEEFMKSYEFRIDTAKKEAERLNIQAEGIKDYHAIIDQSLTESILRHKGIEATQELAKSNNAKVVIIGSGKDGLPLILNTGGETAPVPSAPSTNKDSPASLTAQELKAPEQATGVSQ
jgi:regulator of protease activity HflC (stomatin/prohibitin superfamily)